MYGDTIIESKDYVTLPLPAVQPNVGKFKYYSPRSLRRRWNQLPRLQRVLVVMVTVIVIVCVFFFTTPRNADASTTRHAPHVTTSAHQQQMDNIDKSARDNPENSIKDVGDREKFDPGGTERLEGNVGQIPAPIKRPERQQAVVDAMKHAWQGYKQYAWGYDHLCPVLKSRHNWLHLGLTLIDALDTLWLMGLKNEFKEARDWVANDLDFNINRDVNLFETTIRVLGGLLSSYHLSKDRIFLNKAVDLGDRLLGAFNSHSGIPFSDVNLATGQPSKPKWGPDSSTSEVSTIQLEFRDLSKLTGDPKYASKVNFVMEHIHKQKKLDGLVPIFINAQTGDFRPHSTITLGARADSYYEYLLKQWIQMGRVEDDLAADYKEAVQGMEFHLSRRTHPNNLLFLAELHGSSRNQVNKMDELACFLPGTLALGVHNGMPAKHLDMAKELLYTCVQTWLRQPTNLAPEITYFNVLESGHNDFYVRNNDAHYLLRPETIESLYYLHHFTGNSTYQDWGWQIFQAIEKYCKVDAGYTSIGNVKNPEDTRPQDKMESFFLGETLKYFFLLFSDDQQTVNLDKYVFNTEGHPLPVYEKDDAA